MAYHFKLISLSKYRNYNVKYVCKMYVKNSSFWVIFCNFMDLWSSYTTQYLTLGPQKYLVVVSVYLAERNLCETILHTLCIFQGSRNPYCWSIFHSTRHVFMFFHGFSRLRKLKKCHRHSTSIDMRQPYTLESSLEVSVPNVEND